MRCYVCREVAREKTIKHRGRSVDCPACGPYKIGGTVLHLCRHRALKIDVDVSRKWLAERRKEGVDKPFLQALL